MRCQCNNLYRRLRNIHFSSICQNYRKDPKRLWNVINTVTHRSVVRSEPILDADPLNNFFHSIVTDPTPTYMIPFGPPGEHCFSEYPAISESEVLRQLQRLDGRKAPGPDGLQSKVLKAVAPVIAPSLTAIYNTSLRSSKFPVMFKFANVTPILKSRTSDPEAPSNYRPVSLTSILGKVLERLVLNCLCDCLKMSDILHDHQFGFRAHRSTSQLLTLAVNDWKLAQDRGETTSIAFVDLSKAFDRVQHQHLLFSLHSLGLHGSVLRWFGSYLSGRYQRVLMPSSTSSYLPVSRGVPQGSILRPTLFNIYLLELPQIASEAQTKLLMFADDKTLYTSDRNPSLSAFRLSISLQKINDHLQARGMLVNTEKTVVMVVQPPNAPTLQRQAIKVCLSGVHLSEVDSARCLGVTLDNRLTFAAHINNLSRRVNRKIGALRRSSRQLSLSARRLYLVSVIQPDLEYALPVFLPSLSAQLRHRLAALHRRAVRVACGAHPQADILPLLEALKIPSLEYRYVHLFFIFIFQCYCLQPALCLSSLFPTRLTGRVTRGSCTRNMEVNRYRTMLGYTSFSSRSALLWNALPNSVKSCTTTAGFCLNIRTCLSDSIALDRFQNLLFTNVFNQ